MLTLVAGIGVTLLYVLTMGAPREPEISFQEFKTRLLPQVRLRLAAESAPPPPPLPPGVGGDGGGENKVQPVSVLCVVCWPRIG